MTLAPLTPVVLLAHMLPRSLPPQNTPHPTTAAPPPSPKPRLALAGTSATEEAALRHALAASMATFEAEQQGGTGSKRAADSAGSSGGLPPDAPAGQQGVKRQRLSQGQLGAVDDVAQAAAAHALAMDPDLLQAIQDEQDALAALNAAPSDSPPGSAVRGGGGLLRPRRGRVRHAYGKDGVAAEDDAAVAGLLHGDALGPDLLAPVSSSSNSSVVHSGGPQHQQQPGAGGRRSQRAAAAGGGSSGSRARPLVGIAATPCGDYRICGRQFYVKQDVWWQQAPGALSYRGRVISREGDGSATVYMVDLLSSHPVLQYVEATAEGLHPLLHPGDAVWAKAGAAPRRCWSKCGALGIKLLAEQRAREQRQQQQPRPQGRHEAAMLPWQLGVVLRVYPYNGCNPIAELQFGSPDDCCFFLVSQLELVHEVGESSKAAAARSGSADGQAAQQGSPQPQEGQQRDTVDIVTAAAASALQHMAAEGLAQTREQARPLQEQQEQRRQQQQQQQQQQEEEEEQQQQQQQQEQHEEEGSHAPQQQQPCHHWGGQGMSIDSNTTQSVRRRRRLAVPAHGDDDDQQHHDDGGVASG
jgi:hypothetical protein